MRLKAQASAGWAWWWRRKREEFENEQFEDEEEFEEEFEEEEEAEAKAEAKAEEEKEEEKEEEGKWPQQQEQLLVLSLDVLQVSGHFALDVLRNDADIGEERLQDVQLLRQLIHPLLQTLVITHQQLQLQQQQQQQQRLSSTRVIIENGNQLSRGKWR